MARSRLAKRIERESKHTLILTTIGIIIVIIFVVFFGVPFLINISVLIDNFRSEQSISDKKEQPTFVEAPILDDSYSATNSALITIKGASLPKHNVKLFINNKLTDIAEAKDDGSFIFDNVALSEGNNNIAAKAIDEKEKESNFSEILTIIQRVKPPSLEVYNPKGGETFRGGENTAKVTGKTEKYAKITINDFWAIVDSGGNFSYTLPLHEGENPIKVIATDEAGNKTENEVKVNYAP